MFIWPLPSETFKIKQIWVKIDLWVEMPVLNWGCCQPALRFAFGCGESSLSPLFRAVDHWNCRVWRGETDKRAADFLRGCFPLILLACEAEMSEWIKHNQFAAEVFSGGNKQLVICLNKKRRKEIRTLQYCNWSREYRRQGHGSRSTPAASCALALPWCSV